MNRPPRPWPRLALLAGLLLLVVGGVWLVSRPAGRAFFRPAARPESPAEPRGARPATSPSTVSSHLASAVPAAAPITVPGAAPSTLPTAAGAAGYLGIEACRACHAERVADYQETAHARSLRPADAAEPLGVFVPPGNRLATRNPELTYEATTDGRRLYQTSHEGPAGRALDRTEAIDLVMGSGKLGYSYLYWRGPALFQLPLTYVTLLEQWTNSPGLSDRFAWWDRPIEPRCLECHATYFEPTPGTKNLYQHKQQAVLAISCECCHGPGAEHVAWHQEHPQSSQPRAIGLPSTWPRARQLEVCSQCHGAIGLAKRPAFSYRPGEPLEDFLELSHGDSDAALVHSANQLQRLSQAQCFLETPTMTCTTCHDPHRHERDEMALFSARCQECHEAASHVDAVRLGPRLRENCLDCHMPRRDDTETPFKFASGAKLNLLELRDHQIAVYAEADRAVRQAWSDPAAPAAVGEPADQVARRKVADSWRKRAGRYLDDGQTSAALDALDEAVRLLPRDVPLRQALASLALHAGQSGRAIATLEEAAQLAPQDAELALALALAHQRAGNSIQAAAQLRAALERLPGQPRLLNALAWLLATDRLETLRDGPEARRLAEQALAAAPEPRPDLLDTLAAACAEAGDFPAALEAVDRAISLYESAGQTEKATACRQRRDQYAAGRPHRAGAATARPETEPPRGQP